MTSNTSAIPAPDADAGIAPPDDIRSRILDGAEFCLERFGLQKTTIEDIAKAAGVSRATVYRYVKGGRDEIVLEVLLRVCAREMALVVVALPPDLSLDEQLVEGIVRCVEVAEVDERLATLFSPEVVGFAGGITGAADALIDGLATMIHPILEPARVRGEIDPDLADRDIAQFICHMITAALVLRSRESQGEDALRSMLRTFLVRGLQPRS